ncbi:MAG: class I SAM-dependent methyltransferase [Phycisphaerae bacterium]|jgi:SAM-dependent methyltransferase
MARRIKPARPVLTARTADRHRLYQLAVQEPDAELAFVSRTFTRLRGRPAVTLREDFCGTALSACGWVKRRKQHRAIGVDLCPDTLAWGKAHNLAALSQEQQSRVHLAQRDVRSPDARCRGVDVVLAMNFSYWTFKTREALAGYFRSVRSSLGKGGVFFLDHYGGYEAFKEIEERRRLKGFTYVWDQASYNPITGDKTCHIHFEFKDGTRLRNAFTYEWRLWTLPEIQELLHEAGFKHVHVYWEGDDGKGGGNGIFRPSKRGEACACHVSYLSAHD